MPDTTKPSITLPPATREEARAWAARWKLVNEAEAKELQTTPIDVKFRQLEALLATPYFAGELEAREADIAATREVWKKLRAAHAKR